MLLVTVLMVGFIGISSPFSIFAQEYYDDYESEYSQYYNDDYETKYYDYESYMKDDNSKPSIQKISCNNIINNQPVDNNVDTSNAFDLPNGNSQSGQDRMNPDGYSDQKGDFVLKCITNNFITETTINNDNLNIENNNAQQQSITQQQEACTNDAAVDQANSIDFTFGDVINNSVSASQSNSASISQSNDCEVTQSQSATNANQSIIDNDSGVITSSSIANVEQPLEQSQQIKSFQTINGIEIQQQKSLPIDLGQSQLSSQSQSQSSKTSPPLTSFSHWDNISYR